MHLARFPRARFAHLPTPLEPLPRLGAALGIDLWVKRDDCTGLAGGGSNTIGALGYVDCARETMAALAHRLVGKGAQSVVAGCTEVPLVLFADDLSVPVLDATEALARRCVAVCLGQEETPSGL